MITPEQRAAGEATLRQWRHHQPDQVPCQYCGTLVWLQHAEPVPEDPADPYDRYACTACGADGQGRGRPLMAGDEVQREQREHLRARVVVLAQQYRRAVEEWETMQQLARSEAWAQREMEHCARRVEVEQHALFVALEDLEGRELEEETRGR